MLRVLRSLIAKLILLLVVFVTVPVILYSEFKHADAEKQTLLLRSVREQGRLMAESLRPILARKEPSPLLALPAEVARLATPQTGLKVLFRPRGEVGADRFFFVAAEPAIPPAELERERDSLIERGVLDSLVSTCVWEEPIALRHARPGGGEELLTSISPITTEAGCWALVTTHSTKDFLGTSIGQPYWQTLEVRVAAMIYLAMALLTIGVFLGIWRSLMRFRRLAREIRTGAASGTSFAEQNRVPELAVVASEFDRMIHALQSSADGIRRAAEDNAHAFKTPIAILRQALEPLRRIVPGENQRGRRALEVLEESIDRLDHLVAAARHLEETTAELIDAPRRDVDLSRLVERMLDAYADSLRSRGLWLETAIQPRVVVSAGEDLLETVLENVIDNAISLAPQGSGIVVALSTAAGQAELRILDHGPGVPEPYLERIFERYVSLRPKLPASEDDTETDPHPGIGLWIVRRNVEALGGSVHAEPRDGGGLVLVIRLPRAR